MGPPNMIHGGFCVRVNVCRAGLWSVLNPVDLLSPEWGGEKGYRRRKAFPQG
jgi:hypothetical protein